MRPTSDGSDDLAGLADHTCPNCSLSSAAARPNKTAGSMITSNELPQ
jgi:hypothetical protein